MKITDAAVWPYPAGDTSVQRFALEAGSLGYDSIIAIGAPSCESGEVTVLSGIIIAEPAVRSVIPLVKKAQDSGTVISVTARDNAFNRAVLGLKGVRILRGIHAADRTAFDHVTAKMAADNNIAVDLDLSPLISARGVARQRAIQRYRDILTLERRYAFPVCLSSHARSYLDLRSVREVSGLCSLIGMDLPGVERSLDAPGRVLSPARPAVRVVDA